MNDPDDKQMPDGDSLAHALSMYAPVSGNFSFFGQGEIVRRDAPARAENTLCRASVSLAISGRRTISIGNESYEYGSGQYLLNCVDSPCVIHGLDEGAPFLSVSVELDLGLFERIYRGAESDEKEEAAAAAGSGSEGGGSWQHVFVGAAAPELTNAFLRLVRLIGDGRKARFVAPLIIQEIHCYLALGPHGKALRSFYSLSSQSMQIIRAVSFMREHCGERLRIENLARMVNMGESTFNRNFKKVTSLSPLQFHKRLKLYEARRLMTEENMSAASACFAVGYESQQQFTREYKRLFGYPPLKDVRRNS